MLAAPSPLQLFLLRLCLLAPVSLTQPQSGFPPVGRPLVPVEVVCGGGIAAMRGSQQPYEGCMGAFTALRDSIQLGLGDYVNVSFVPVGFVDGASGVGYCRDGDLECNIYSVILCGQQLGTSPAITYVIDPGGTHTWLNLPVKILKDMTILAKSNNLYLSYWYGVGKAVGYDWENLLSCARSEQTLQMLTGAMRRSAELGLSPAADGGGKAAVFVGGQAVEDWHVAGSINKAICSAYAGAHPPAVCQQQPIDAPPRLPASPPTATAKSPAARLDRPRGGPITVEVYCTGTLKKLHDECARAMSDIRLHVFPVLGDYADSSGLRAINASLVPAGVLGQVFNGTGMMDTPYCYGGWAECEIHKLILCAAVYKGPSLALPQCLYWATLPEVGGKGQFWGGRDAVFPVSMCLRYMGGDLNW
eukprot:COSAG01_NODE_2041_length_8568_cov_5.033180_5_plen_417_part_00